MRNPLPVCATTRQERQARGHAEQPEVAGSTRRLRNASLLPYGLTTDKIADTHTHYYYYYYCYCYCYYYYYYEEEEYSYYYSYC